MISDCCGAPVMFHDICQRCKEHCEPVSDDSDDGYDAARDAYNMGYGPPVTWSQRNKHREEMEEFRRSGGY